MRWWLGAPLILANANCHMELELRSAGRLQQEADMKAFDLPKSRR